MGKFRFVYLLHKFELVEFTLKLINIVLKFLHKHADMIPVTDSVMHLDCQRQQPFAIPLKELTHGENRQQELAVIKHIDGKVRKLYPGHYGDMKELAKGPPWVRNGWRHCTSVHRSHSFVKSSYPSYGSRRETKIKIFRN